MLSSYTLLPLVKLRKAKTQHSLTKHLSKITFFLLILFVSILMEGCERPDQVAPGEHYCTSGRSVLTVDDSHLSAEQKGRIYSPGGIVHTSHADYNTGAKLVIIPFEMTDFPRNTAVTTDTIRNNFFQTGTGSVKDYFLENSWGQFSLQNAGISGWVSLQDSTASYGIGQLGNDWTRNANVARDICQRSTINWASLDTNGDRIITPNEAQITFMFSAGGLGATRPSTVSISTNAGNYTIRNSFVYFDCKRNNDPSKATDAIRYNFSTIWHELGHGFFRLPDRYTSYCGTGNTGQFDIMSDNCSRKHMNIYDKMRIGWIRPKVLGNVSERADQKRHCYSFPAIETTPAALVLWSAETPDDFWIVENRHAASSIRGFESGLPESGLAIWWVDMTTGNVHLVQSSDPSKNPTAFRDQGTGSLFVYDGTPSETFDSRLLVSKSNRLSYAISAVSPAGNIMYAEF